MSNEQRMNYTMLIETNGVEPVFRLRRINPTTGIPELVQYQDLTDSTINDQMAELAVNLRIAYELVQAVSLKGEAGEMESNTFDQFCNDSLDKDADEKINDLRLNDLACRIATEQLEKIANAVHRATPIVGNRAVQIPNTYHKVIKDDVARITYCRECLPDLLSESDFDLRLQRIAINMTAKKRKRSNSM